MKFDTLLEGLEAAVIRFSQLERTARFDSEYFQRRYIESAALVEKLERSNVASLAAISDGNHFTISEDFVEVGIPYYRGQDVVGTFFIETASPNFITEEAFERPYMKRSHLKKGDVLLSIVGTIGELSLVGSDAPQTCSCKLAILRPHSINAELLAVFLQSEHGRNQVERLTRGAIQKSLLLEDMDQLAVPKFSGRISEAISLTIQLSKTALEDMHQKNSEAELCLSNALGLTDWVPPEPLTYVAAASQAFAASRLDAEHFKPKFAATMNKFNESKMPVLRLSEIIEPIRNGADFRTYYDNGTPYIRVADIKNGRVLLDSAAKIDVNISDIGKDIALNVGDVLFTRKGSFGNAAAVNSEDISAVISSEIMLLRILSDFKDKILPPYLAHFFNCRLGKIQAEQWAHGVAFYSISQDDLSNFHIPIPSLTIQRKITELLFAAHKSQDDAKTLLNRAKRAVEISIEDSETAALRFLEEVDSTG